MTISQSAFLAQERRQKIASLYLQGKYQSEIAREVGVTQQQVSYDLKALRAAWLQSSLRDFDAAKSEELRRVDEIERQYWRGWERSQQPRAVTVTEQMQGAKASRKASVRREDQTGDPRFLDGVLKCIERRCSILGLDAARSYKINWDALSDVQLERLASGERWELVVGPPLPMAEA